MGNPDVLSAARRKFRGALLGAAVGDALGAPFEGMARVPAAALEGLVDDPGPLRYTDDTHMTLGVARSLVECRGFDGAHMARLFARNFLAEPERGYGAGPPHVFRLLQDGVPWDQAASRLFGGEGSFGNGGAMRVAPVAMLAGPSLPRVAWLARETARITHAHEVGMEGAVVQACAVASVLRHPGHAPLDPATLLGAVEAQTRGRFRLLLGRVAMLLRDPAAGAQALGNGIAADESVPTALFLFLRQPGSFVQVMRAAIGLGGDTDTIASMAGALAGAHLGEEAIPPRWREHVEGVEELRGLADQLLALAADRAPEIPS